MDDFKLKISLGEASVELEGESAVVKEMFDELRTNGLGALTYISNIVVARPSSQANAISCADIIDNGSSDNEQADKDYPVLEDFLYSDVIKDEQERILIFSFYLSSYGKDAVDVESIKTKYRETKYWNRTVSANFQTNMRKLIGKKKYLRTCDSGYLLTKEGREEAERIIFSEPSDKAKNKKNKPAAGNLQRYEMLELGLSSEDKKELMDLFRDKENLSAIDKTMLVSFWYKENKKIDIVNINIIYTLLKSAGAAINFSIKDSLGNAKRKNYFYPDGAKGEFQISHIGEAYVNEKFKQH